MARLSREPPRPRSSRTPSYPRALGVTLTLFAVAACGGNVAGAASDPASGGSDPIGSSGGGMPAPWESGGGTGGQAGAAGAAGEAGAAGAAGSFTGTGGQDPGFGGSGGGGAPSPWEESGGTAGQAGAAGAAGACPAQDPVPGDGT